MGHSTTTVTNTKVNKTDTQNINEHDTNTYNTNQQFNTNRTVDTTINGNSVGGRSVLDQNSGNAGLQCFGMKPGDPACKMHTSLQNLHMPTQPIEQKIHDHVINKMAHLRETNPTEYIQKLHALQILI